MYKFFLIFLIIFTSCFPNQKKITCPIERDEYSGLLIVMKPDIRPEFTEGYAAFYKQVMRYFQYPKDVPLQTKVILELIIDKKGKVISTKIHKKKEEEYTLVDKEGIRVMTKITGFKPARCNNKRVCSKLILPIILLLKS